VRPIYLDYNSTTPLAPSVQQALLPFLAEHYGNPSAPYALGRAVQEAVEDARGQIASLIGCDRDEVVFTSGGTESNHLAILGTLLARRSTAGHVAISAVEHASIRGMKLLIERLGYSVSFIPVNAQGVVTPGEVRKSLKPNTVLVSVMHANDETGVVQPIRQIAAVCRDADVSLHTDASQSAGRLRTLVDELEVDLLTISGHKMHAPKGIGALYVRGSVVIDPLFHGEGQEAGFRAGTENVLGAVGLGKAAAITAQSLDESQARLEMLRNRLEVQLLEAAGDEIVIHGQSATRLPNTSCISFRNVEAHEILARIPELYASSASASQSTGPVVSATLSAMKVPPEIARGTIRLSSGWYTTEAEIDRAVQLLLGAWESVK
jgi:cysteine desulfurase